MSKSEFKPSSLLNPTPVVMVSCGDMKNSNIITIAWAGTVCSNPPMLSISVKKERMSYDIIDSTGEFVVNLVNEELTKAADFCGVKSGRDVDKFEVLNLSKGESSQVAAPYIVESPINIECKVIDKKELGSHDMFIAEVVNIHVNDEIIDSKGRFDMGLAKLVCYSHGEYWKLDKPIGFFGYSIASKKVLARRMRKHK